MDVLLIGGTGLISEAVTELALARGHTVWHLNRGLRSQAFAGRVRTLTGDIHDRAAVTKALGNLSFDVVANFIAFTPAALEQDVEVFLNRTRHYLLVSSATVYQKPPSHHIVTESTTLNNPFWLYARNKIAMEEAALRAYRERGFPVTIVRPSYTYSKSHVPGLFGLDFHHFERIRAGQPLPVHGDGQSLWVMTSNEDFAKGFVGLFGNPRTLGEAYHITSDEVLTWDQIFQTMGRLLRCEPKLVHIPIEFIRRVVPQAYDGLKGDKMYSWICDNAKIKSVVPDYRATVSFYDGMARCLAWYKEHPEALAWSVEANARVDRLVALWEKALAVGDTA